MKKKKYIITIIIIFIIFGFKIQSNAANTTNTTNTTNTANTINTNTTSSTSNTVLTSLGIRPYDFTGFKNAITSYNVTVPNSVDSVEVYATAKDPKAKLEGTGKIKLQTGKNVAQVTVTAEDGTKKTFTINITRSDKEQTNTTTSGNTTVTTTTTSGNGLKSLKIKDINLNPEFSSNTYEYTVKYIGEAEQLEIEAQPEQEDYIVEITGNKDLKEGENLITILVSKQNGDNVATYQITVNKSLVDVEAIARQEEEKEKNRQRIIMGGAIAILVLIIIIIMIIKHKRNTYDYDYDEEYEDEDEEEDLPRALQNKNGKRYRGE